MHACNATFAFAVRMALAPLEVLGMQGDRLPFGVTGRGGIIVHTDD